MGVLFLSYIVIDGVEFGFEKFWSFLVILIYFVLVVIKYLIDFKVFLMNGIMFDIRIIKVDNIVWLILLWY